MAEKDLKEQIEKLDKKLRDEQLTWNEKLREKEKENFELKQKYNHKKLELDNEIARLKYELSQLHQNKEAEIIRQNEEFGNRIKEKEKRIEELLYEKEQLVQKNDLLFQNEKEQYEQKIIKFQENKTELAAELNQYKNDYSELKDRLKENGILYEHEQKILRANFEKEKAVLNEGNNYKQQEFEERIDLLNDNIVSLKYELEEKEKIVKREQDIREAETSAIREEGHQKINHLDNVLKETIRQKDHHKEELAKIKEELNNKLQLQQNENEFLSSKSILREEELSNEIQNKSNAIQDLTAELHRIQQENKEQVSEIRTNWAKDKNVQLKEIDFLKLEVDKLNKQAENLRELREIEGNNWRHKVEQLENDYQVEIARRDVAEEESENGFINKINLLQGQLEEVEISLERAKDEKIKLIDDFKKRLADRQDEIDNLNRDIENLKALKDDQILRKKTEFERMEENLNTQLEDAQDKSIQEKQQLQEKLDNLQQEKHKLELDKGKTIESLIEQLKAKKEELDSLKRISIEKEAQWNKRLLEAKQEKELSEEEKNRKEEELEKLKLKLRQEVREMAEQLEKRREHWEWLIAQKQSEINKVKRESQENIFRLKEEYSTKRRQIEATQESLEKALKELIDKIEKEREGKYRQLKEKDARILELEAEFERARARIAGKHKEEIETLHGREMSLELNIKEFENKLTAQQEIWEEKLALKEREFESLRQNIKDREEEMYNTWKEKRKSADQKITELTRQIDGINSKQKQGGKQLEEELERQKKLNWESKLSNTLKEKEIEAEYQAKLNDLQGDKDKLENGFKVLKEQFNTERIAAFRKLREKEEEIQDFKENASRDNEDIYKKYTDKAKKLEEIKSTVEILQAEKDREVKNLLRQLEAEKREKENLLHEIKLKEEDWRKVIQQKQEDSDREKENLITELRKLQAMQHELLQNLKTKEGENQFEIKKLKEGFENKELQLIEEFKEKEKIIIVKKSELEDELNRTAQELNRVKRDMGLKEGEVRRQVSGEYENKIYKLKLDEALAKSELDWVRDKLSTEREKWQKEIEDKRNEYKEKSRQLDERMVALESEKEVYQKRMDTIRRSYQEKIDRLYNDMHQQKNVYESNIESIRQQYSEANMESVNLRQALELNINGLKLKLENENKNNSDLNKQLSEYSKRYEEIQSLIDKNKNENIKKIQTLNEELENANNTVIGKIKNVQNKAEEEKNMLQAKFIQAEKNLKAQIEEKRQKLITKENEINNLKLTLGREKIKLSDDLKVISGRLGKWQEKEDQLKQRIEQMQQVVHEAQNKALEAKIKADTIDRNRETEINQSRTETEKIIQIHEMEKSIFNEERDRLKQEIKEIKEDGNKYYTVINRKEEQIEKINKNLEETYRRTQQQIDEQKIENKRLVDDINYKEQRFREKVAERESELNVAHQHKLDEKENHWREIYASREKELLVYRNRLQEELEELKREKLSGERMWDVRLKDKEESLKNIQLEKAQNESNLTAQSGRLQKELNEFKARYNNSNEILKEKDEQNRELRARMAQRDIQWKTTFKNKQLEVKRLTFEMQQNRRGMLVKFIQVITGIEKKNKQDFNAEIERERSTVDIIK